MRFRLQAPFTPTGDQPEAIRQLVAGARDLSTQVLLGVTGSGKTYTVANVIEKLQRPTLVIAHNKTLAAQLYQEFRDFFPDNAVSYFVSYYDYYQPEAYIPSTDTYIEKEATINDEIDRLRLSTTTNLLTRQDVIVVASVSAIYNLGSPVEYGRYILELIPGQVLSRLSLFNRLTQLQYERSETELTRGTYRVRGDTLQIWPANSDSALRLELEGETITAIKQIDAVTGSPLTTPPPKRFVLYPAKHYLVDPVSQKEALAHIRIDLAERLVALEKLGRPLEALRLKQKVTYDLEMIEQFGFVNGIENYSRYFDGRATGEPPFSLLDYFAENVRLFDQAGFLTVIDESHMTLPQIRGMHHGDRSRKETLIEHGFRLPSALDNRPLMFDEFLARAPQLICVSATPGDWELKRANYQQVEQLIRPTGLVDPLIALRPIDGQIEDLVVEIICRKLLGQRCLVTTLTKRMCEDLTEYLNDPSRIGKLIQRFQAQADQRTELAASNADHVISNQLELNIQSVEIGKLPASRLSHADDAPLRQWQAAHSGEALPQPKVAYLHADVETLDRSDILAQLRQGDFDVLIGINLLREGLDLPEVSLVAILDADKEGFLRSATALIQTMGRAARHLEGLAVLYADNLTASMKTAIHETQRRRKIQTEYNRQHSIQPISIAKPIRAELIHREKEAEKLEGEVVVNLGRTQIDLTKARPDEFTPADLQKLKKEISKQMKLAAKDLNFEAAARLRDLLKGFDQTR